MRYNFYSDCARGKFSVYTLAHSNPESAQMDNVAANTYCRFRFQYWSPGTETACSIISAYVAVLYALSKRAGLPVVLIKQITREEDEGLCADSLHRA